MFYAVNIAYSNLNLIIYIVFNIIISIISLLIKSYNNNIETINNNNNNSDIDLFSLWKTQCYSGSILNTSPLEYEIISKPNSRQYRSPLWTYNILLKKKI